jgi:hypothetical protein
VKFLIFRVFGDIVPNKGSLWFRGLYRKSIFRLRKLFIGGLNSWVPKKTFYVGYPKDSEFPDTKQILSFQISTEASKNPRKKLLLNFRSQQNMWKLLFLSPFYIIFLETPMILMGVKIHYSSIVILLDKTPFHNLLVLFQVPKSICKENVFCNTKSITFKKNLYKSSKT